VAALLLQINGVGVADYTLEGDQISVTNIQRALINYVAIFDDVEMVNTVKLEDFAPLFVSPYNSARFTCEGDALNLQILNQPNALQISFVRVKPSE
jgi:hypothetical protein